MEDKILESIAYILPAAVTGCVAYYMFSGFMENNTAEKKIAVLAQQKKDSLPIKLQAYERLMLFSDRINPVKLLVRIKPISDATQSYLHLLIANIEQELEHNLVQQIYVSTDTWTAVLGAKNAIISTLKENADTAKNANSFRENVLIYYTKTLPPTETAIAIIKNEVKKLL